MPLLLIFTLFFLLPSSIRALSTSLLLSTEKTTLTFEERSWVSLFAITLTAWSIERVISYTSALPVERWRRRRNTLHSLQIWVVACLTTQFVYYGSLFLFVAWTPEPPTSQWIVEDLRRSASSPLLLLGFLCTALFTIPFLEELLFRGLLYEKLRTILCFRTAALLSSALFALLHSSGGIGDLPLLLALWVFSYFLAFVYEREETLWAPIGLHTTFNAMNSVFLLLPIFDS